MPVLLNYANKNNLMSDSAIKWYNYERFMFKGSLFIRIMSYIPFISSILSPTLLVLGHIGIIDLIISIIMLVGTIYILIHYGIRIYKVGILNYSGSNLWKKMFEAIRRQ